MTQYKYFNPDEPRCIKCKDGPVDRLLCNSCKDEMTKEIVGGIKK